MKYLLLLPLILTGCAIATAPRLRSTATTTNKLGDVIVEVKETKGSAFVTWGDAAQVVEKLRVSNGKTHSIGLSGYDGETSSTNVPAIINAGGELIGKAAKAFIAP
jgi:hypothetical protein